mmetsp:Transcript_43282/g.80414  ORF Transcript_43282/g.80414 Transcript_43282/m.80414 type:complete len:358 (-) Transcript_43282:49-1122(-)
MAPLRDGISGEHAGADVPVDGSAGAHRHGAAAGGDEEHVERVDVLDSVHGGDPLDVHYDDDGYGEDMTLEEELSEILEAFYSMVSEDEIRKYQAYVEECEDMQVARRSIQEPDDAPDFELVDQDGDMVRLSRLLEEGPVVLVFYRGKWCPQCNATLKRLQQCLELIKEKGANLVAISPMLPDGSQIFSSKFELHFPVLSDVGNHVARKFNITFTVPEHVRSMLLSWGEDVPEHNGDDSWEIPIPATYIISKEGKIVWSYLDENSSNRAEPEDIVAAIPAEDGKEPPKKKGSIVSTLKKKLHRKSGKGKKHDEHETAVKDEKKTEHEEDELGVSARARRKFGRKKQDAGEFLGNYMIR